MDGLATWCQSATLTSDEAFALFSQMYDFLVQNPDLLESSPGHPGGMSYPEVRSLIERNVAWGIR